MPIDQVRKRLAHLNMPMLATVSRPQTRMLTRCQCGATGKGRAGIVLTAAPPLARSSEAAAAAGAAAPAAAPAAGALSPGGRTTSGFMAGKRSTCTAAISYCFGILTATGAPACCTQLALGANRLSYHATSLLCSLSPLGLSALVTWPPSQLTQTSGSSAKHVCAEL